MVFVGDPHAMQLRIRLGADLQQRIDAFTSTCLTHLFACEVVIMIRDSTAQAWMCMPSAPSLRLLLTMQAYAPAQLSEITRLRKQSVIVQQAAADLDCELLSYGVPDMCR